MHSQSYYENNKAGPDSQSSHTYTKFIIQISLCYIYFLRSICDLIVAFFL